MQIVAFITEPPTVRAILAHLGDHPPTSSPPLALRRSGTGPRPDRAISTPTPNLSQRTNSINALPGNDPRNAREGRLAPGVPRPATPSPTVASSTADRRHFLTASDAQFAIDRPPLARETLRTSVEIPIRYPLSVIRYPLSVIRYPLSVIRYPLSVIRYPLSSYPLYSRSIALIWSPFANV